MASVKAGHGARVMIQPPALGRLATAQAYVRLLRPRQWLKNGVVAAAVVFAGRLSDPSAVVSTLLAVAAFCGVSSAGYVLNDIVDASEDRRHPVKRYRPIAAGLVAPTPALALVGVLLLASLVLALLVRPQLGIVAAAYAGVTFGYSLALKRIPILDMLAVTAGFVLRALAGAIAVNVPASMWLLALTALVAFYVVVAKRLTDPAPTTLRGMRRPYHSPALRRIMIGAGTLCCLAYVLYTLLAPNLPSDHSMLLTAPFVALGLARYAHLAGTVGTRSGPFVTAAPEEAVVHDRPLLLLVTAWALTSVAALYWIR